MPLPTGSHRSWFLELNNYTSEDVRFLLDLPKEMISYLEFCKEKCPTTGTPHLHVFITFQNTIRANKVKYLTPTPFTDVQLPVNRDKCLSYIRKSGKTTVIDFRYNRNVGAPLVTKEAILPRGSTLSESPTCSNDLDKLVTRCLPSLKVTSLYKRRNALHSIPSTQDDSPSSTNS